MIENCSLYSIQRNGSYSISDSVSAVFLSMMYTGWANSNGATLRFPWYLKNYQRQLRDFCTHQGQSTYSKHRWFWVGPANMFDMSDITLCVGYYFPAFQTTPRFSDRRPMSLETLVTDWQLLPRCDNCTFYFFADFCSGKLSLEVEMTGNGFLHSHSLPFPCYLFPFPPIPIPIFHLFPFPYDSHRGIPIPSHSHPISRCLLCCKQ